ncbi:coenzyme F390 synthetase [Lachnospiraceae bacterium KM106-2]|nr:coenzyme F390 synthetase [Lachnospiraceae bacterium KM106-2]
MNKDKLIYYIGDDTITAWPMRPYNEEVIQFLDALSKNLRGDKLAQSYPDIMTFAFYIRKANIQKKKETFDHTVTRCGRGLLFHIAPSNVPINFAFSLVFGLLAGNSNIVRVSTKDFPQTQIVCDAIAAVLTEDDYSNIRKQIAIVRYERDKEITDFFSAKCDGRIIWGGDRTISEIKESKVSARCEEIHFADRFSFAIIDPAYIKQLSKEELIRLAEKFYNDTYLMDQNACSAPHLILWDHSQEKNQTCAEVKDRFYDTLQELVKKYPFESIKASDKYLNLCLEAAENEQIKKYRHYGENRVYVLELKTLDQSIIEKRGKYGTFYEYDLEKWSELGDFLNSKVQTCATAGIDQDKLRDYIVDNHLQGIDRIVSFGDTLNIDVVWDGMDVISKLSRVIA